MSQLTAMPRSKLIILIKSSFIASIHQHFPHPSFSHHLIQSIPVRELVELRWPGNKTYGGSPASCLTQSSCITSNFELSPKNMPWGEVDSNFIERYILESCLGLIQIKQEIILNGGRLNCVIDEKIVVYAYSDANVHYNRW